MEITIQLNSVSEIFELRDLLNRLSADANTTEPIRVLNLEARTIAALVHEEICTIEQLLSHRENDLLKIPNFGRKSLNEVIEKLKQRGLRLSE